VGALKAVEAIKDDLVTFTQEIVRIPSLTNDEEDLARAILAKLKQFGFEEAWIDGIGNVIGVLRGDGRGPNVMLNGHLDAVPPGILENWENDPYGAEIKDGVIYGRGTVDVKAGLASCLFAAKMLKDLRDKKGISLPGDVIFSAVVNEENAECFGAEYLCQTTLPEKDLSFDLCFLSEPTKGRVYLGHRGKVELVVTTRGETAHSSTPWRGINAVQKMLPVLDYIFKEQQEELKGRTHPKLGFSSVTVTNILARPGALSIVPDECEISIDRRYVPGESLDTILAEFEALFEELKGDDPQFDASVKVRTFHEKSWTGYEKDCQKYHPVWVTEEDHPFVQKTVKALKAVGQPAEIGCWNFGTDGSMMSGIMGIPCIGFQWGDEKQAHRYDEHVTIQELVDTVEGYAAILCELFDIDLKVLDEA
jgi:putative selenium metabolism hydrolase